MTEPGDRGEATTPATTDTERGGTWDQIEEAVAAAERTDAPDPWADVDVGDGSLTDDQVAFLTGGDQPPVPRLAGQIDAEDDSAPGNRTG